MLVLENTWRRAAYSLSRLNPKAIAWERLTKHNPQQAIITRLGRTGLKVRIYPEDVIGRAIFVHGFFEPSECRFVRRFLKPGMTFLDLGANLGQYTLLAAWRVGKTGAVHSFEPSSRMFSELEFNLRLNGLSDICVLNRMAVSDSVGTANLSVYEPGAEVFCSLGTRRWENHDLIGYEEVETTTIDDYVESHKIANVDLIKMDIEGAELLALRGAARLLSQSKAPAIMLEVGDKNTQGFGYQAVEICEYLKQMDYRMYGLSRQGKPVHLAKYPDDHLRAGNIVAMKNDTPI